MWIPLASIAVQTPLPSAPEIIRRSQRAYDAVKTFEQDVKGGSAGYVGTAHISFSRPDRLRVSGRTGFGSSYDLLCDGRTTWLQNNGAWQKQSSVEMGIATITGISAQAGTLSPAMLTHSRWGRLSPDVAEGWTVKRLKLNGRTLILVEGKKPFASKTWFDARSFFVVKTEATFNAQTMTVEFSQPKVDQPLPASRFKR